MSLVAFGCLLYGALFLYYTRENRKRESRIGRGGVTAGDMTEDEVVALGDENPAFRYAR